MTTPDHTPVHEKLVRVLDRVVESVAVSGKTIRYEEVDAAVRVADAIERLRAADDRRQRAAGGEGEDG